jgi:hypothetical protein
MEKRPEKIIPWRQHHLQLDVAIRKERSSCRQAGEVASAVVVVLIFSRGATEKTIPSFAFTVIEEEEEINSQY